VDKKSVLAIVISALVMGLWFFVFSPLLNGKKPFDMSPAQAAATAPAPSASAAPAPSAAPAASTAPALSAAPASSQAAPDAAASSAATLAALNADIGQAEKKVVIGTDLVEATFSNLGGIMVSARMLKHKEKDAPVELVLSGDADPYNFGIAFGDYATLVDRSPMRVSRPTQYSVEFSRAFEAPGPGGAMLPFTLKKTFTFKPGDYLFELKVSIENSINAVPSLSNGGYAYTLFLGPQIGPKFEKLSTYGESRRYYTFANGKRKTQSIKPKSLKVIQDRVRWASVTGKYFTLAAVPDATAYTVAYNTNPVPGLDTVSQLSLSRPAVSSSVTVDTLRFYLGPNIKSELARYSDAKKNTWGYADLTLEKAIDSSSPLAWMTWWLEVALKWLLELVYKVLPNWGVAIIIVTLIVKAILFPLTLKSSIGTAKMAELQPKIAELQAKYKDKPERLNQEMAEFYKREGYNPLSGCLPLLIQLPLFFAMYGLFNTHFDLRNAMFIPGWIPDLSLPDSVLDFPTINLLIWRVSAIRILPIIYLVSQLFYGKFTQSTATPGQNKTQMNIMLYGMPAFFFFILYDAPAGLLVYWITSNLLTIVQQIITNRIIHERKLKAQRS
jgi:YidC/Oxa1 family membrane protein insertase